MLVFYNVNNLLEFLGFRIFIILSINLYFIYLV